MPEFVGAFVCAGDRSSFCIPNGVKQLQVIDVVKQWIDQHAALRHYTAASLGTEALKESFLCKQGDSHHHGRFEQIPGGFKVIDANGQSLAYVYSRDNDSDALIANVLTTDEARRIASNIAKLPKLLSKGS